MGFLEMLGKRFVITHEKMDIRLFEKSEAMVWSAISRRSLGWVCNKARAGVLLVPGLVFTVEPMINMGGSKIITDNMIIGPSALLMGSPLHNGKKQCS